jgi:hypothetical protein
VSDNKIYMWEIVMYLKDFRKLDEVHVRFMDRPVPSLAKCHDI